MFKNNKYSLLINTLATTGIVYGDIGTSPLYTLKECFNNQHGINIDYVTVFGFLSIIFWLLIIIVSIKYLLFVMKANDAGEGGILTLTLLSTRNISSKFANILIVLGLLGGSFFYGETVITPAISVVSATEGLQIITPFFKKFITLIAIIILTILFTCQKYGTTNISKLFTPIMIVWFLIIGILGIVEIIKFPEILTACNPKWAFIFIKKYHNISLFTLSTVILSITGVEALYADMGHFGALPIRLAWFFLVLPTLILNYFGQGALVLSNTKYISNPFFFLAPSWAVLPLLIISTMATVIASQAVISGIFSLTKQAINLNYLPSMKIIYTSEIESGQIYIPLINWLLYIIVLIVIIIFKHSSNLAAAYGITVTSAMVLTSILLYMVVIYYWKWNIYVATLLLIIFLCLDVTMFTINILKTLSGGWLTILISLIIFVIMIIWRYEKLNLFYQVSKYSNSLSAFIISLNKYPPIIVPGTAVFISYNANTVPIALLQNLKHNKIIHTKTVLLNIKVKNTPLVHNVKRVNVEQLSPTFWRVIACYGFKETPNMEEIFDRCKVDKLFCQMQETSFFISYESLILNRTSWYFKISGKLFTILYNNSVKISDQYLIPTNRVVKLGTQIEI
ncbi:MAG: low affinity potassium transporter Kup [Candidatus Lightella neohaematopini]|nr:low affinity potassium transporter Kup [Candidatus Lightella neohaematopini]